MKKVHGVCLALFLAVSISNEVAARRPEVVTFSRADIARLFAEACGPYFTPRKPIHAHRNSMGTLVYLVSEEAREAVILSNGQQCNELSSNTLDLWRADKGQAIALVIEKEEGRLLMIGESESRGQRFDIDRSGTYAMVSNGTDTVLSAVARPYRALLTMRFDGQRIFVRKKSIIIVGNNTAAGRLEARPVSVETGSLAELPPIAIGAVPAGVRVLDYSEASDDLLLGGVDAAGATAFMIYNLGTGETRAVPQAAPGDEYGLFIADSGIRARLNGQPVPAPDAAPAQPEGKGGLFRRRPSSEE